MSYQREGETLKGDLVEELLGKYREGQPVTNVAATLALAEQVGDVAKRIGNLNRKLDELVRRLDKPDS